MAKAFIVFTFYPPHKLKMTHKVKQSQR